MSQPQSPKPVKLVIGLFMKEKERLAATAELLTDRFGPADLISPWYPFDFTTYYDSEMGGPLFRRMFAFETLIEQDGLSDIKLMTNQLEEQHTVGGKRNVNIDPGYLSLERFVLATGKNFTHRIYIGKGIYADLTLLFQKGEFVTLPWTYPDYAHHHIISFLLKVRKKYIHDMKRITEKDSLES